METQLRFIIFFTREVDYLRPPLQIIFYSDLRHQGRSSQVRWPRVRSISLVTMGCIQRLSWVVMHYNSWCIACSHHLLFLFLQLRLILYEVGLSYCGGCIALSCTGLCNYVILVIIFFCLYIFWDNLYEVYFHISPKVNAFLVFIHVTTVGWQYNGDVIKASSKEVIPTP